MSSDEIGRMMVDECKAISNLLAAKNKAYGNSALDPIRILSNADPIEQIKIRIDDKLSRLMRGTDTNDVPEDTIQDIIGYFILLNIAQKLRAKGLL